MDNPVCCALSCATLVPDQWHFALLPSVPLCCLQAFAKGVGPFLEAVMEHDFIHATKLTLMLAAITVPLNTLFGTVAAILITRNEFPGKVSARQHGTQQHSIHDSIGQQHGK